MSAGDGQKPRGRSLKQRVKSASGRRVSSSRWLERQLNDPYVSGARAEGWRSRAAYKLIQLDAKHHLLKPGGRVLDLGAAPGGWTQVAVQKVGPRGVVVGVDLQAMDPINGAVLVQGDANDADVVRRLRSELGGQADAVISDMANSATGHRMTDHIRTMMLAEQGFRIAEQMLAPGGCFVAKVLRGGAEDDLLTGLKRAFRKVIHVKPEASRQDSREIYVVALGFRGSPEGS